MGDFRRRRSTLHVPVTLSVGLMVLNIILMVCWIVLLARTYQFNLLTIGVILFVLMLIGLSLYLAFVIKEVRLNQRQANFVDSVTHELKTPIASLKLCLETLQLRDMPADKRDEFLGMMQEDVRRLDHLISQLLEVSRLDELGSQEEPEDVPLEPLLRQVAQSAAIRFHQPFAEAFKVEVPPLVVHGRPLLCEMIFGNLIDNATKYSGEKPRVEISARARGRNRVVVRIADNGVGVPAHLRNKIFQLFYRAENEMERRTRGTGVGLFIVKNLVTSLSGRVSVHANPAGSGTVFEVELPGRAA
jgi:signal transduction histidine kinase